MKKKKYGNIRGQKYVSTQQPATMNYAVVA